MAPVPGLLRPVSGWLAVGLAAAVLLGVLAPTAFSSSSGMSKDAASYPGDGPFLEKGCVNCHGGGAFAPAAAEPAVNISVRGEDGNVLPSSVYAAHGEYTVTITLAERAGPNAGNHAGFNLRVTGGELSAEGHEGVQVAGDSTQATHTDATRTEWTVAWTAPEEGAVLFDVFVNDVDGDASPSPGDQVHRTMFALTDSHGAQLGAAVEHEEHVGVPLPQYWLGLIALAGMLGVMVFGYVYIKYMSPHHSDQKDR